MRHVSYPCCDQSVSPGKDDGRAAMTQVDAELRPLLRIRTAAMGGGGGGSGERQRWPGRS
jgi:hypothetical protein